MPALYYEVERLSRKYILVIDYYGNDKHSGLELKSGTVDWHKRDYSEIFPKFRLIKFEKYLPEIDGFSLWLFERKV